MKQIYLFFYLLSQQVLLKHQLDITTMPTGNTLKTQLYTISLRIILTRYAGLYVTYETSDIDNSMRMTVLF
jgi:hypothetical protein